MVVYAKHAVTSKVTFLHVLEELIAVSPISVKTTIVSIFRYMTRTPVDRIKLSPGELPDLFGERGVLCSLHTAQANPTDASCHPAESTYTARFLSSSRLLITYGLPIPLSNLHF